MYSQMHIRKYKSRIFDFVLTSIQNRSLPAVVTCFAANFPSGAIHNAVRVIVETVLHAHAISRCNLFLIFFPARSRKQAFLSCYKILYSVCAHLTRRVYKMPVFDRLPMTICTVLVAHTCRYRWRAIGFYNFLFFFQMKPYTLFYALNEKSFN